jgi:hypothetical protein
VIELRICKYYYVVMIYNSVVYVKGGIEPQVPHVAYGIYTYGMYRIGGVGIPNFGVFFDKGRWLEKALRSR